jgi:hypothetical protein
MSSGTFMNRKLNYIITLFGILDKLTVQWHSYGVYEDKETLFINASTCTYSYMPTNRPIVFDVEIVDKK